MTAPTLLRAAARKRLPRFLFDYLDGGAGEEETLARNVDDLNAVALRQRVLRSIGEVRLDTKILGRELALPVVLGPIGLLGMYARRGEVQAARAAEAKGVVFTLSTVSVCSIAEVTRQAASPWFQLYVLKDRGFMRDVLDRARAAGVETLVFTVDMAVPGIRHRDASAGMSGRNAAMRRLLQAATRPRWAWDVGLHGRPHELGNIATYLGKPIGLDDYMGWLGANFDPTVSWRDVEWLRDAWAGNVVVKGIMEVNDARDAVRFGAQGIVVSNHGGRQLDGAPSTVRALPAIADAVKGSVTILADSGIRSGTDVLRMIALGAEAVMLGRPYVYALATQGERGVKLLLDLFERELRTAMTLMGVETPEQVNRSVLYHLPDA